MNVNKKIFFYTFGCKVNQSETTEIISDTKLCVTDNIEEACLTVINCCSVTAATLSKISKIVNKSILLNNIKKVWLIGCITDSLYKKYFNHPKISIIKKSENKFDIIKQLKNFSNNELNRVNKKTRYFLKIQDGCKNFCSYCIVPYLRTKLYSLPIDDVIKRIRDKAENGYKEIVLCGISTGNYGQDINENNYLYKLLNKIRKTFNKKNNLRLRLTSLNPDKITDDIIKIILNENIFCNHIHLPLQSGSDKILKIMKRKYTQKDFLSIIDKIRNIDFSAGITTDIISGFPGETENDVFETLKVINKSNFLRTHLFTYSKREITEASKYQNHIEKNLLNKRYAIIKSAVEKSSLNYLNSILNKNINVLVENNSVRKKFNGYSSEYIMCKIYDYKNILPNSFYKGVITDINDNSIVIVKPEGY